MAAESPFTLAAGRLLALGYSVVPIMPPGQPHTGAGKAPGSFAGSWRGLSNWQRFRDRSAAPFEFRLWTQWPDANIGLILGTPAGGDRVIAIDIDAEDPEAFKDLVRCLPPTPMRKKGAKGETRFYRASKDIKTKSYNDANKSRLVDLLTGFDTRQTVCPPSLHPKGMTYHWLQGPVAAADLPLFGEDDLEQLEDTLRHLGWDPDANRAARQIITTPQDLPDEDDFFSESKRVALANLDTWVPKLELYNCRRARGGYEAVATWRPSSSGQPLEQRKRNLSIQTNGIKDFGTNDTYSAIDLVMVAKAASQEEATRLLRGWLGLTAEVIYMPPATIAEPAAIQPEPAATENEPQNSDLPDELTRVPGLVGEITDWITATAMHPNRPFALMAAAVLVGTAAGRQFIGPTDSATHLYVLTVAGTGTGKNHAPKQAARILRSVGQQPGPKRFMSASSLYDHMAAQPCSVCFLDEFGSYLAKINSPRAGGHEREVSAELRSLWGASFETIAPARWANSAMKQTTPILAPALSLYGMSVPKEFYAAIQGSDIFNGFLNRFLIIASDEKIEEVEPELDQFKVPDAIINSVTSIFHAEENPLARATKFLSANEAEPTIRVGWSSDSAKDKWRAFRKAMERDEEHYDFVVRSAEMAIRLATIRAIGINPSEPAVTLDDVRWGCAIASWSARRMITDAAEYMVESEHQGKAKSVLRIIKDAGVISKRNIVRKVNHRFDQRTLEQIIAALEEGGQVAKRSVIGPSGGRPSVQFSYTGDS